MTSEAELSEVQAGATSPARRRRSRLAGCVFLVGVAVFVLPAVRGTAPDAVSVIVYGLSIVPSGLLLLFDTDNMMTGWGGRYAKMLPERRKTVGRWVGAILLLNAILAVAVGVGLAAGVVSA
jgi:hypothetical protein